MKSKLVVFILAISSVCLSSCNKKESADDLNIVFLHHSTGEVIWYGAPPSIIRRAAKKVSKPFADFISRKSDLSKLLGKHNKEFQKNYHIREVEFPKAAPYGWNNNPYDYYNIWVKNSGDEAFMEEPTLEMLTKDYQVIIFKHCYPVCNIKPDEDSADIASKYRSLANYKLQYLALRDKLHEFPDTRFILFTGATQVKYFVSEEEAKRSKEFFNWVTGEWDLPDDNIYLWDLYGLQTEGGLYFKEEYAASPQNSHPNKKFAKMAVGLLNNRIIDVIEHEGKTTALTGKPLNQ